MEKKKKYLIIAICGVIGIILGSTLAWYTWVSDENTDVTFTIGGVNITYEAGDDITGRNLRPVSTKEVGVENNYAIKKDITVSSNQTAYFSLYLNAEVFGTGLQHASLKWELYENDIKISNGNFGMTEEGDRITLLTSEAINTTIRNITLYIWIDGNMSNPESMQNQEYKFVLNAEATDQMPTGLMTLNNLGLTSLVNSGNPNYSVVATTDEGIYAAEDDLGISYYFRGASERNYVYFAEHYWRIIRINGDGTIRMIYDGTTKHENGEVSEDRQLGITAYNEGYNEGYGDNAYVGYMYGTAGSSTYEETHANVNSSTIKNELDEWYKTNIDEKGYSTYVADEIYCNDRQVGSSGDGIGKNTTNYLANDRLRLYELIPNPTLKCEQVNDRFTRSTELGNGVLTYPVGLITADEVAFAGGMHGGFNTNNQYYLYTGFDYWTMSPCLFRDSDISTIWNVRTDGRLSSDYPNSLVSTRNRPVISLKADTLFEGNGTYETPFAIAA